MSYCYIQFVPKQEVFHYFHLHHKSLSSPNRYIRMKILLQMKKS